MTYVCTLQSNQGHLNRTTCVFGKIYAFVLALAIIYIIIYVCVYVSIGKTLSSIKWLF